MRTCSACGSTAPESFLACPSCHALFHAQTLTALVARADASEAGGDLHGAVTTLREALALLPSSSAQAKALRARVAGLEEKAPASRGRAPAWLGGLGAAGLVLWKLLGPLLALAPKLKLLFFGLLQAKTVLSMLVTTAFYREAGFGPPMLGVLASVYVHEMGHVYAFKRYGIETSAPMFVPGFGAFVRGGHYPESRRAQADVALSGPIWGAVSGLVPLVASFFVDAPWLYTVIILIAEINAFNLLPVWQLDGGRAFETIGRRDRFVVAVVGLLASVPSGSMMGIAASLGFAIRAAVSRADVEEGEPVVRNTLCGLFVGLALLRAAAIVRMG